MSTASHEGHPAPALSGVRVIDLCDHRGALAGRILADLGAEVIKVEPRGGEVARSRPPFDESPGGDRTSLSWAADNAGKKCVALDIHDPRDRQGFVDLVRGADVLLETVGEAEMALLGLGYRDLSEINPGLVHTSITPFGSYGPYARFATSDIVMQAMGSHMYVTGDQDRPPLSVSAPVAYAHGGAEGAAAALIAYYERTRSGRGQHVDVSIQQCVVWTLLNSTMTWQLAARNDQRGGAFRRERGLDLVTRFVWECADGFVHFVPVGGGGGHARQRSYDAVVDWMVDEGHGDPILRKYDWNGEDSQTLRQEEYDTLAAVLDRFLKTKTVEQLYEFAVRERVLLAPVMSVAEILSDEQLRVRDAWREITLESGRVVRAPGAFAKFSATPLRGDVYASGPGDDDKLVLAGTLNPDNEVGE